MKEKFPVQISVGNEPSRRFKATTSIDKVREAPTDIHAQLAYLEEDYSILIDAVRSCLVAANRQRKVNPRLMWLAGDYLYNFLKRLDGFGFYLVRQNHTLARDVGISRASVEKVISFRRRFPRLSLIDPTIPWNKYRDNLMAPPLSDADEQHRIP